MNQKKSFRKGFTIVELLVVVAIIGVLLGIVSVAARGAIKNGRVKRAEAMGRVLEQAIAAYNAKIGKWPTVIESKISSIGNQDKATYTFSGTEADSIFNEIVSKSVGKNATLRLLDASALFVADRTRMQNDEGCFDNHSSDGKEWSDTYCAQKHCINGVDFSLASNKKNKRHITLKNMAYGYPGATYGKFCRFWITYNVRTDAVTVSRKHPDKSYPKDWQ